MVLTNLQGKTPERGLSEIEITNLLDKNFKIKVISILMDLQKNIPELRKDLNKKIEDFQKSDSELTNTVFKMKNTTEGINSQLIQVEKVVGYLEIREHGKKAKKQKAISCVTNLNGTTFTL